MIDIRPIEDKDWNAVWSIVEPVLRAGETYPFSPDTTKEEAFEAWVTSPAATFVAENAKGQIVGSYYMKPNQPGLGGHVCNCGYVVAAVARAQGVGSAMCDHSQREAAARGFRAMQYNLVVSTNESAIRLWKKHGFEIVGTLPGAFRHRKSGFVDAHVMYKVLKE